MAQERLPRPVRIALGATGRGVGDRELRLAVDGKTVLVTGASSGIGEAAARRLAAAGATVLLVARRAELLERLRDDIAASGGTAHVHPADLSDVDSVGELCDRVLKEHEHVDVIVNNAGKSIRRWLSESEDRQHDFERTTAVNYLGPVRLMLGLTRAMRERRSGHIVNISSAVLYTPPMRWTAYAASKAAFETWLRGAAPELRADGVTCTNIRLPLVRTPMLGPFRIYRRTPAMSAEEAAGMVCRAIVYRPRNLRPWYGRISEPVLTLLEEPIESLLTRTSRTAHERARRRST